MSCCSQIVPFCRTYPITRSAGARRFAVTWHPMRARPPSGGPFADWSTRGSSRWWAKAARPGTASPAARPCTRTFGSPMEGRPVDTYGTGWNSRAALPAERDLLPYRRGPGRAGDGGNAHYRHRSTRYPRRSPTPVASSKSSRSTCPGRLHGWRATATTSSTPIDWCGPPGGQPRASRKARRDHDPQSQGRDPVRRREHHRDSTIVLATDLRNLHALLARRLISDTNPGGRACAEHAGRDRQSPAYVPLE